MNRHDVHLLQQIRGYPCITITLPTHRTSPDNKQDPLRVKNLVKEATDRLLGEFQKREVGPVLVRLEQLAEGIDYRYLLDGLVLCVHHDFSRGFSIPFPVKERVVIDETFFTRDLIFALNRTARYWVLVLSEKPTRLFEGIREDISEIQSEGFPMTHEGPGGAQPLPGGFGVKKSAYRDERHRQFFRQVDNTLKPFLADDPLPLVVVGVDRFLSFFNEVTNHKDAILTALIGSHDKTSPHELNKLVWPIVKVNLAEQRRQALSELEKAMGERRFASTVGEVWQLANEGRGRLLLVEKDFHFPARLDESGKYLIPVDDVTAPEVMDDAIDEIIWTVLDKQGKVVFVENDDLEAHQRIALILRY